MCAGWWGFPAGQQEHQGEQVGPGWTGVFQEPIRLCSVKDSGRLHPSVPLRGLDQEPHRHQPAGILQRRSRDVCTVAASAAVAAATLDLHLYRGALSWCPGQKQRCSMCQPAPVRRLTCSILLTSHQKPWLHHKLETLIIFLIIF